MLTARSCACFPPCSCCSSCSELLGQDTCLRPADTCCRPEGSTQPRRKPGSRDRISCACPCSTSPSSAPVHLCSTSAPAREGGRHAPGPLRCGGRQRQPQRGQWCAAAQEQRAARRGCWGCAHICYGPSHGCRPAFRSACHPCPCCTCSSAVPKWWCQQRANKWLSCHKGAGGPWRARTAPPRHSPSRR